jgi:hypothetical protein
VSPWKGISNQELITEYAKDYGKVVPDMEVTVADQSERAILSNVLAFKNYVQSIVNRQLCFIYMSGIS